MLKPRLIKKIPRREPRNLETYFKASKTLLNKHKTKSKNNYCQTNLWQESFRVGTRFLSKASPRVTWPKAFIILFTTPIKFRGWNGPAVCGSVLWLANGLVKHSPSCKEILVGKLKKILGNQSFIINTYTKFIILKGCCCSKCEFWLLPSLPPVPSVCKNFARHDIITRKYYIRW